MKSAFKVHKKERCRLEDLITVQATCQIDGWGRGEEGEGLAEDFFGLTGSRKLQVASGEGPVIST